MSQVLSDEERRELVLYHHAVFMPEFDGPMLDAVESAILAKLADRLKDAERLESAVDRSEKLKGAQLVYLAHQQRQKAEKWDDWCDAQERLETQMPEGWRFVLDCSPGDWSISLHDPEGNDVEFDRDCDSTAQMMCAAIDAAIDAMKEKK